VDGIDASSRQPDASPWPSVDLTFRHPTATNYAAVLTLCGEHDMATSSEIAAALSSVTGDVLVDLSKCEFIDSTVIGVLLKKAQELKRAGSRIDLVVPPTQTHVARTLEITGIDRLLTLSQQMPGVTSSDPAG
jgi:anti-sigma B factor antagonist